ncbi:MAG: hypothetical protein CVU24_18160, partial [Betaproteobacteria bacterium HGW-Betaproteobacteria-18]
MTEDNSTVAPVIPLDEVRALIAYASDRAIEVDPTVFEQLERAVYDFESAVDDQERYAANQAIRKGYGALTKVTYPTAHVTGRSLIDTPNVWRKTWVITIYGCIFFALAATTEILSLYIADQPAT